MFKPPPKLSNGRHWVVCEWFVNITTDDASPVPALLFLNKILTTTGRSFTPF